MTFQSLLLATMAAVAAVTVVLLEGRRAGLAPPLSAAERWCAVADSALGGLLIALGVALLGLAFAGIVSARRGAVVHPDAVLFPMLGSVVSLGLGALFRLAALSMRRGARRRWRVQWMVLLAPLMLAAFVALSFL